jgi:hypothetical protein
MMLAPFCLVVVFQPYDISVPDALLVVLSLLLLLLLLLLLICDVRPQSQRLGRACIVIQKKMFGVKWWFS